MKRKRYSRKFQRTAVERLRSCEDVRELARELRVTRRCLYTWRAKLETVEPAGDALRPNTHKPWQTRKALFCRPQDFHFCPLTNGIFAFGDQQVTVRRPFLPPVRGRRILATEGSAPIPSRLTIALAERQSRAEQCQPEPQSPAGFGPVWDAARTPRQSPDD